MNSFEHHAMREYARQGNSPEGLLRRLNMGESASEIAESFDDPDELATIGATLADKEGDEFESLAEAFLARGVALSGGSSQEISKQESKSPFGPTEPSTPHESMETAG